MSKILKFRFYTKRIEKFKRFYVNLPFEEERYFGISEAESNQALPWGFINQEVEPVRHLYSKAKIGTLPVPKQGWLMANWGRIPVAEFKAKPAWEQRQLFQMQEVELCEGVREAYKAVTQCFNFHTDLTQCDHFLSNDIIHFLQKQLECWRKAGASEVSIQVHSVEAKICPNGIRLNTFTVDPNHWTMKYFSWMKRLAWLLYTRCEMYMNRAIYPVKVDIHVEFTVNETITIDGESTNYPENTHIFVFSGIHQGLRPFNIDIDSPYRRLLVTNINYTLDPWPREQAPVHLHPDLQEKYAEWRATEEGRFS